MGTPLARTMHRQIKVKTEEVIAALKANKEKHIVEYVKAKEAYKLEGLEQVEQIKKRLQDGKNGLCLKLVEPIDRVQQFDEFITMFEMEVEKEIELDTEEFKLYVLDKGSSSEHASLSNTAYFSKFGL